MADASGLGGIIACFGHRNFRIYFAGNATSLVGTWMQRVAAGWLAWELTHSPTWLGIVAMADFFPTIFLGPLGGALADRYSRVTIMIITQVFAALASLALCAMTLLDVITPEWLVVLVALSGVAIGLYQAARLAIAPSLVPPESITTAIALSSICFNGARFVGPAIAAWVIADFGSGYAFGFNAVSYVWLIIALAMLRIPKRKKRGDGRMPSLFGEMSEGVRFCMRSGGIGPLLLILIVSAISVRGAMELLPGFADNVFGVGASGFGYLVGAAGGGATIGGLYLAHRGGRQDVARIALIGTLIAALANILLVATDIYVVGLIACCFGGLGLTVAGVATQSAFQFAVTGSMRGRVLSLYGTIYIGGPALGALIVGSIAEWTGLRLPLFAGALICLAVWLAIWMRRERIIASLVVPATASADDD
jgi:MFS family permease